MKAYWTEGNARVVTDEASLAAVIAEVNALGEPTMLFLEHDDGRALVVGLGADETVLTYVTPDGTSYHSVGDAERPGMLKFWCRDQVDDFLAEFAVPSSTGTAAAEWFSARGEMLPSVTWEPDCGPHAHEPGD